jgi:transcriptional regulator with PAS, ATPase and Fis domain
VAGAFTDAKKDKPGRFAMAKKGTIFLDEIGDISQALQVRLLRVLQEKVYEPLGAVKAVKADVRVITATNRTLEGLIKKGLFRDDLYYRINVIKLSLPTLAERKEDIPLLVEHFIDHFNHITDKGITGVSDEVIEAFMHHDWPGNIRELENAIEHAFVLCQDGVIRLRHLPRHLIPEDRSILLAVGKTLKEIERRAIHDALMRNDWRRMATARELGIDKNTLRRKVIRLGINEPVSKGKEKDDLVINETSALS